MTRTIQHITSKFIDLLPENEQYYRLSELREWGLPSFIVKRIKVELERNLAESMIPPRTDWANVNSEAVQEAWQQFVDAIRAEARLPASYAKTVIETAVADVVEMLLQPRENIPEVIFGSDKKLDHDDLVVRLESVVVYRHFKTILLRYMQKKKTDHLTKEKCAEIIRAADEKMTAKYSPLNWAQMLDPLFVLLGDRIDTNLLRLFFEDKNAPRVARRFDLTEGDVSRAELIEILSSPELLNFEGYEDEQSSLFDRMREQQKESAQAGDADEETEDEKPVPEKASGEETVAPAETAEHPPAVEQEQQAEDREGEEAEEEESLNKIFSDEHEEATGLNREEPDDSLNRLFTEEEEKGEDSARPEAEESMGEQNRETPGPEEDLSFEEGVSYVKKPERSGESAEQEPEKRRFEFIGDSQEDEEENEQEDENPAADTPAAGEESEHTPMWMRYMDPEELNELEELEAGSAEEIETNVNPESYDEDEREKDETAAAQYDSGKAAAENGETEEDGFIEEPIIDLTRDEETAEREIRELQKQLSTDRDLFVENIFRGSERAFDEAIEEISTYESWQEASKYIEKDIFKRNLVDMYSEAAVDFTDQLQTYFLEKQNRN